MLVDVAVRCPRCSVSFISVQFSEFFDPGTRNSELRAEWPEGCQPFEPFEVCTCPSCGNSDWMASFPPNAIPTALQQAQMPAHLQYRNAALGAERDGRSNFQIGMFYLYAAWCADDVSAAPQAREYRRLAADAFARSLVDYSCPTQQRPELDYLIGELLRRSGDFNFAQEHLRKIVTQLPGKFALMGRKVIRLAEQGRVEEIAFDA